MTLYFNGRKKERETDRDRQIEIHREERQGQRQKGGGGVIHRPPSLCDLLCVVIRAQGLVSSHQIPATSALT